VCNDNYVGTADQHLDQPGVDEQQRRVLQPRPEDQDQLEDTEARFGLDRQHPRARQSADEGLTASTARRRQLRCFRSFQAASRILPGVARTHRRSA